MSSIIQANKLPPVTPPGKGTGTHHRLGKGIQAEAPSTFARPGTRQYSPYQGRAFGRDILPNLPPQTSAGDVLNQLAQATGAHTGAIGRVPTTGSASPASDALGGLGTSAETDPLVLAALRAQGLA
jgi:hypothetical protein